MTLTNIVLRFLKEENLYHQFYLTLQNTRFIYDTIMDDMYMEDGIGELENLFNPIPLDSHTDYPLLRRKWICFLKKYNYQEFTIIKNHKTKSFNIVAKHLAIFTKERGLEEIVNDILKNRHKQLCQNTIDVVLRHYNVPIYDLFISTTVFGNWSTLNHLLKPTCYSEWWYTVSQEWAEYCKLQGLKDIIY